MSAQNFFEPGLDLSSLTSITQAQLMQALSQMSPISNIGVVIYQAITPNVTDNPIFARCIWADTSAGVDKAIFKFWSGADWIAGAVSENAIDDPASIKNGTITLIKMNANEGSPGQVARIKTSGTKVLEYVDPASLFVSTGEISVDHLEASTDENDYHLVVKGGSPVWFKYDPTLDLTNVSPSVLQGGAQHSFLVTKGSGDREWSSSPLGHINDLAKASDTLNVNKLTASGLSEGDQLKVNGSGVWVSATPKLNIFEEVYQDAAAIISLSATVETVTSTALSGAPKMWKVVAVSQGTEAGYAVGDEVDYLTLTTLAVGYGLCAAFFDITDNKIKVSHAALNAIRHHSTGAPTTITAAGWKFRAKYIM